MRAIDADALIADCQLAQKQADRHGREFANAFYSGGGEVSTEWWCVEDMIENAPTIEPQRKKGMWIYGESEAGNDGYYCSKCGNFVPWKYDEYDIDFIKEFLFCNKCGADMTEGEG